MFKALRRRQHEQKAGKMPSEEEMEEFHDNLAALAFDDPSVSVSIH